MHTRRDPGKEDSIRSEDGFHSGEWQDEGTLLSGFLLGDGAMDSGRTEGKVRLWGNVTSPGLATLLVISRILQASPESTWK